MGSGRRRTGAVLAAIAVLVAAGLGGWWALRTGLGPLPDPEQCVASVDDYSVAMSTEQAENASIIAAVAERRRLPARAVSIAIATAFQESKLENLDGGDRDSLGLFQQRPSQGWGSKRQIMDPYYATNAFYDALIEVDGYEDMPITEAAQAVQRSAFPDAYADHEQDGRTIASAMSGNSPAAFSCSIDDPELADEQPGGDGLTARAAEVRADLSTSFGELDISTGVGESSPDDASETRAHEAGRGIYISFGPDDAPRTREGWVLAHYLVANADRLHVERVVFDDRVWEAGGDADEGWRDYEPPGVDGDVRAGTRAELEHRGTVHVAVA